MPPAPLSRLSRLSCLSHLCRLALLAGLLALGACRKEVPTPSPPPADPAPRVDAITHDTPGASDREQAPPTIGAVVANQDKGGAKGGPAAPTGGDGRAPVGASAASR
jgi:hypothetical protein